MIKESVQSATSKVFGDNITKASSDDLPKKTLVEKGLELAKSGGVALGNSAADELVRMISSRSPVLGEMAQKTKVHVKQAMSLNKLRAQQLDFYNQTQKESSLEFKKEIQKDNPGLTSTAAVDKAMLELIKKLSAELDRSPQEAKQSVAYEKYGKYFEDYSEAIKKHTEKLKENNKTEEPKETKPKPTKPKETDTPETLDKNPKKKPRAKFGSNTSDDDPLVALATKGTKYLLGKVFGVKKKDPVQIPEEGTNSKESGQDKETTKKETNTDTSKKNPIVDELKKINKFLEQNLSKKEDKENEIERKNKLSELEEKLKEKLSPKEKPIEKTDEKKSLAEKAKDRILDKILPDDGPSSRKKSRTPQTKKNTGRVLERGKDGRFVSKGKGIPSSEIPSKVSGGRMADAATKAGRAVGKTGAAISRGASAAVNGLKSGAGVIGRGAMAAAPYAMPALAVTASGLAGYELGETVVNPLLNAGLSKVMGRETTLGSELAEGFDSKTTDVNRKLAPNYYQSEEGKAELAKAKETRLAKEKSETVPKAEAKAEAKTTAKNLASDSNIVTKTITAEEIKIDPKLGVDFNSSPKTVSRSTRDASSIKAALTSRVPAVTEALNKKEEIDTTNEKESKQPIVVNAGGNVTNNSTGGGGSSAPALVGGSVRNTDSTYERVQMQDFWPRAA